jgi:tripartite-type tricarboxylate transporter receptor subunit TctC
VLFEQAAGVKLVHVPFRGSGPAVAALVGNHVPIMFAGLPSVIGNIKNNLVRPLALASPKRTPALPDRVTAAESGLPGFEAAQRYGLIAPAGTPPAIVAKLNKALQEALTSDDVKAKIAAEGAEPVPGTPDDYAKDIAAEWAKWSKVVKDAGIKAN